MSGHLPNLNRSALARLRRLARSIHQRQAATLPLRDLVAMAHQTHLDGGLTIDFGATAELGEPMIVVRIPDPRDGSFAGLRQLTARERQVAALVARGLANKQIAARLGITTATVKDHIHHILEKSDLPNRAAIAAAAVRKQS
jgi:DNA-binding NarL/FixJ family response regulator